MLDKVKLSCGSGKWCFFYHKSGISHIRKVSFLPGSWWMAIHLFMAAEINKTIIGYNISINPSAIDKLNLVCCHFIFE